MKETIVQGPSIPHSPELDGSFWSRLPKLVAAWPAAGRTSTPPSTHTAAMVTRVLRLRISVLSGWARLLADDREAGACSRLGLVPCGVAGADDDPVGAEREGASARQA